MHIRVPTPHEHAAHDHAPTSTPTDRPKGPVVSLIIVDDAPLEVLRETLASALTLEADPALDILVVQTRPETAPVLRDILRLADAVRILQRPHANRAEAVRLAASAAMAETLLVVAPGLRLRPSLVAACLDMLTEPDSEVHIRVQPSARPTARPTLEVLHRRTLDRLGAVIVDPPSSSPWRAGAAARPTLAHWARRLLGGVTRAIAPRALTADRP